VVIIEHLKKDKDNKKVVDDENGVDRVKAENNNSLESDAWGNIDLA